MNLREMMDAYSEEGLTRALAASRVCQDIVLKAISEGPLNRNVTIKGGVVMRSLTQNNRRATQDPFRCIPRLTSISFVTYRNVLMSSTLPGMTSNHIGRSEISSSTNTSLICIDVAATP